MPFWQFEYIKISIVQINTWSFFLSLAFVVGLFLFFKDLKKSGVAISEINFTLKALGLIFSILLGARLFNFFEGNWNFTDFFNWQQGGVSFWGGLIAGFIYCLNVFYASFLRQYNFLKLFSLAVIPITISLIIGRVGCFLIKDHPGIPTSLPWAIIWPNGQMRHPVALYLILSYLALLMFLLILKNKNKIKFLTPVFLMWVGASRLFLDFTRIRNEIFGEKLLGFLTVSQWVGFFVLVIGVYMLFRVLGNKKEIL